MSDQEAETQEPNYDLAVPFDLGESGFLAETESGDEWLTRITLLQKQSDLAEEEGFDPGDLIFGEDDNLKLAATIVAMCRTKKVKVPILDEDDKETGEFEMDDAGNPVLVDKIVPVYRPHALLLVDREVECESFDPTTTEFQEVRSEFLSKKKVEGRAPMFGVDMLFWFPGRGFAVYFFAKTARRQAKDFYKLALAGDPFTLKSKKIVARFTWWVPKALKIAEDKMVEEKRLLLESRPTKDQIASALAMFYQPLAGVSEEDLEASATKSDRDR